MNICLSVPVPQLFINLGMFVTYRNAYIYCFCKLLSIRAHSHWTSLCCVCDDAKSAEFNADLWYRWDSASRETLSLRYHWTALNSWSWDIVHTGTGAKCEPCIMYNTDHNSTNFSLPVLNNKRFFVNHLRFCLYSTSTICMYKEPEDCQTVVSPIHSVI